MCATCSNLQNEYNACICNTESNVQNDEPPPETVCSYYITITLPREESRSSLCQASQQGFGSITALSTCNSYSFKDICLKTASTLLNEMPAKVKFTQWTMINCGLLYLHQKQWENMLPRVKLDFASFYFLAALIYNSLPLKKFEEHLSQFC